MEVAGKLDRCLAQKMVIFAVFGLFTANAQAQLLPAPTITVQPLSTNVSKGDTVTFSVTAKCSLSLISSATWYFNNTAVPATTTIGLLTSKITTTLTVPNVSSTDVGNYKAVINNILGGSAMSDIAQLSVVPTVTAVTTGSAMVDKGFKIQFSAPVGSNLVIQATSNMSNWTSLCTNMVTTGTVTYTDAVAKTASCRFYRALIK